LSRSQGCIRYLPNLKHFAVKLRSRFAICY
jgi:hypothetical protein